MDLVTWNSRTKELCLDVDRHCDDSIIALQRPTLQPLIENTAKAEFYEAVASADDGNAFASCDASIDYIRAKSVGVYNVGAMISADRADRSSLGPVVAIANMERHRDDIIVCERADERVRLVAR